MDATPRVSSPIVTERIQLVLFWDEIEWAVEADDLDIDGHHDSSPYAIANPEGHQFDRLDRRCTYQAWGERTGAKAVRIVEVSHPI